MHLKRIDIQGFKSFAEKTKLEFNNGIAAIVGPNGSGKSNISDAVRWVLGEQSVKSLRGGKMEDVVFSGTETRRPLSFAEVSIIIDNSDGELPIEFSEVTVTRAVYRSGDSEYRINGSICKLKDIYALFADTGIGKEGYSIIGQGRIDAILSGRSEDRRFLFEEAAGIVKYRNRRNEAVSKLEKEKDNLIRVNDIITELDGYINKLHDKSEKAKKFLLLKERQKLLHINIFLIDAEKLDKAISDIKKSIEITTAQVEDERTLAAQNTDETAKLKTKRDETEEKIKEVTLEINNLKLSAERREGELNLKNEQIKNAESNISRLTANIKAKEQDITCLSEQKEDEEKHRDSLEVEFDNKNSALEAEIAAFESINTQMSENEQIIDKYNAKIIEGLNVVSEIKGVIIKATAEYEQTELKKEQFIDDIYETEVSYKKECEKLEETEEILTGIDKQIERINAEQKHLTAKHTTTKNDFSDKTIKIQSDAKILNDCTAKYTILSELEKDYSGYSKSVRSVMVHKDKSGGTSDLNGVIGAVGSLIEVKEKHEAAIETALGASIQSIVTNTEEDAKAAINFLKKTGNGRATFLPISAVRSNELGNSKEKLMQEPGIIGVAKDFVKYDKKFENIFSNLLGKTIVADTIDNAIAFMKKNNYGFRTVTLSGELLSPGGAMSGGSRADASGGIVSRIREIKELKSTINKLTYDSKILSEAAEKLKIEMNSIELQIADNNKVLHEAAVLKSSHEQSFKQIKSQVLALHERRNMIMKEDKDVTEKIMTMRLAIKDHEADLAIAETNVMETKANLEQFTKDLSAAKEEKENQNKRLFELRISVTELAQKLSVISEKIERINGEILNFNGEISKSKSEIMADEGIIKGLRKEIEDILQNAKDVKNLEEKRLKSAAELEEIRINYISMIEEHEEKEKEIAKQLARLENEMTRLVIRKEQAETDKYNLYDEIWNEYELTYQGALKYEQLDIGISNLKSEERALKSSLSDLGEVDVGAIEEYKTVRERYDFLNTQRADILDAEEKLKAIISELTGLMIEQFKDRFSEISENFTHVFNEVFGGGKAQLKLTDEDNVLESGIEIIAQPPGKRLVSMSLLSGGERALTAIALLFGILRMKPSPFCILDEVDTALDDMNVMKFAQYLKRFEHKTQFILITHRKGSMEVCDTLYGVTMQERGVSNVISVMLEK